mmetsp:Transcript_86570/g.242504  ORF Transcript_86570/g.242504 Transcript_86570/m.242504 type:complete len:204 (+) Transcript_86570:1242-1853(+)
MTANVFDTRSEVSVKSLVAVGYIRQRTTVLPKMHNNTKPSNTGSCTIHCNVPRPPSPVRLLAGKLQHQFRDDLYSAPKTVSTWVCSWYHRRSSTVQTSLPAVSAFIAKYWSTITPMKRFRMKKLVIATTRITSKPMWIRWFGRGCMSTPVALIALTITSIQPSPVPTCTSVTNELPMWSKFDGAFTQSPPAERQSSRVTMSGR